MFASRSSEVEFERPEKTETEIAVIIVVIDIATRSSISVMPFF